jgi:hypothetical protein
MNNADGFSIHVLKMLCDNPRNSSPSPFSSEEKGCIELGSNKSLSSQAFPTQGFSASLLFHTGTEGRGNDLDSSMRAE